MYVAIRKRRLVSAKTNKLKSKNSVVVLVCSMYVRESIELVQTVVVFSEAYSCL